MPVYRRCHNGLVGVQERVTTPVWWVSVGAAWTVAAAIAATAIAVAPARTRATWLGLALGGSFLAAMVAQLATHQRRGLVVRLVLSVAGALVLIAAATVVGLLDSAAG